MKPNLDLGQHFMVDEELLDTVVSCADISSQDTILEVGPGKGALTKKIYAKKPKKLICVEKDPRFESPLPEITYVRRDILATLQDFTFNKVVSNIPYHISEPLVIGLLRKKPETIVLVVGATFAQKIQSETILGHVVRTTYTVALETLLPPKAFSPPPHVDSALITLKKKKQTSADHVLSLFYEFSKSKVKNYLVRVTRDFFSKNQVKEKYASLQPFLLEKKLYELSTNEFLQVRAFIYEQLF